MNARLPDVEEFLAATSRAVESFAALDFGPEDPSRPVVEAARYAVNAGGKRLRPALVLAAAFAVVPPREGDEAFLARLADPRAIDNGGGSLDRPGGASIPGRGLLAVASAFEYIHTYSLIHDDLPVMDNDAVRRGRPSCHVAFGVPTAVSAGAWLILRAFAAVAGSGLDPAPRIARILESASGLEGMVTGQALDILGENRAATPEDLVRIHAHKTAALIRGSILAGAAAVDATRDIHDALEEAGEAAGLAFQIVDDLLDVESTPEKMGKPVGADSAKGKRTYPSVLGLEESRRRAADLLGRAEAALKRAGKGDTMLAQLVRFVLARDK